jgi:hypothetical protein
MHNTVRRQLAVLIALAMLALAITPMPAFASPPIQPAQVRTSGCGSGAAATLAQNQVAPQSSSSTGTHPSAVVTGGGSGMVSDPSSLTFRFWYDLASTIAANNVAKGKIHVLFGESFGQVWGALPGVTSIQLTGQISSGSLSADGTVAVGGTLTEVDYIHGQGEVFREENIPFQIVSGGSIGTNAFSLQWCELPTFWASVPHAGLHIHSKHH